MFRQYVVVDVGYTKILYAFLRATAVPTGTAESQY